MYNGHLKSDGVNVENDVQIKFNFVSSLMKQIKYIC